MDEEEDYIVNIPIQINMLGIIIVGGITKYVIILLFQRMWN